MYVQLDMYLARQNLFLAKTKQGIIKLVFKLVVVSRLQQSFACYGIKDFDHRSRWLAVYYPSASIRVNVIFAVQVISILSHQIVCDSIMVIFDL